ncbi:methenyltetrahydromethanopterin cyclohydrolase [Crateriforma spongiae]|uniref:methenyltetrahydromethanopterin cyclohydrolase n=1 Tax=Crateriforma spongiae TaxID=2724528 RepID=UPI0014474E78|nr:methenyltetrahydromethanopterin cyclohydrolase [Crateriforma spongiae]
MLNQEAYELFEHICEYAENFGLRLHSVAGGRLLDAGVQTPGSLDAGLLLARLCMGDQADIAIVPADPDRFVTSNHVHVRTDAPLWACLGAQYAGWPVQTDDFFAMGSGPMRLLRGREAALKALGLAEEGPVAVGVLESDKLPGESVFAHIAQECGVQPDGVHLAIAPSHSIAGGAQVVARSIETAMHKLHELKFDVRSIVSATGTAPLPPPSKPGDMVSGIGRTNDAMLYGANVTLWADADDQSIESVIEQVPSSSSGDYGRPFAQVFKGYEYDFYKVDPMLFSPARVTIHGLRSGRTWIAGRFNTDVLRESFLG